MTKSIKIAFAIFGSAYLLSSCVSSGDNPGIEYAPNMYISQAYEPFSQVEDMTLNPMGMTMRLPVEGTVARGQLDYIYLYPNTAAGYDSSAGNNRAVAFSKANVVEGERLYNIYCWNCHGKKGKNDGPIISKGKMPPPAWKGFGSDYIQNLPEGKMYHTITNGKGLMGSHASVLNPTERWNVIAYIKQLSLGSAFVYDNENAFNASHSASQSDGTIGDVSLGGGYSTLVDLTESEMELLEQATARVYFKMASVNLKEKSFNALDKIASFLKSKPNYFTKIIGHSGKTLTEGNADKLAKGRAQQVVEYLISKGVSADKLSSQGKGSNEMNDDIVDGAARKENRRVELKIFK